MEGMRHCSGTGAPPGAQAVYERYSALQDFALGLARQMHLSLVLHLQGNGTSAPPQLSLELGGHEQGVHVSCETAEEAARQLHALGMHYWATQRRYARQSQAEDAWGRAGEMPRGRKGLTRPAERYTLRSTLDGYTHQ